MESGECLPIETIRIIGNRFRFHRNNETPPDERFFQRQVLAFGNPLQSVLKNIHVGVVGVGGTGSSVVEQLIRLGVGRITFTTTFRFSTWESESIRAKGAFSRCRGESRHYCRGKHACFAVDG
jgi:ThiF family